MTTRIIHAIRTTTVALMCLGLVATVSACSSSADAALAGSPATALRLGYFDNVTHAPTLIGIHEGLFAKELGKTELTAQVFGAGPAAIEALSAGAIDAAFLGPSPAINSYLKSGGQSLRVVAGATNGGAALVVRDGITTAADLKGKTLATPQLGNTQDVALRTWLSINGLKTSVTGGGDVTITPTDNAQVLQLFKAGKLDGAWLPEPWVSRLVLEAGAHVLVDEASQWKNGAFPTTVLVVNTAFLEQHPQTVAALIAGDKASVDWLNAHKGTASVTAINAQLTKDSGKPLAVDVVQRALTKVTFSVDPLAATFPVQLDHAVAAGLATKATLSGIFDLGALNAQLKKAGAQPVSTDGLGIE
ncbi:MAG: ABC transporter substrate-binding protein [Microbacteriaceae bacterium]|nr:MAG: ABC transporter substrate-binding protein [Microbacteriaceae bacterium]